MSRTVNILIVHCLLLFGLVLPGIAKADSAWHWEGMGDTQAFVFASNFFPTWQQDASWTLTLNSYLGGNLLLVSSTLYGSQLNIAHNTNDGNYYATVTGFSLGGPITQPSINLGANNTFYFAFPGTDTVYSVLQQGSQFTLTNGPSQTVFLQAENISAIAVPVPGAGILIGTGLLGLLGAGARKKHLI